MTKWLRFLLFFNFFENPKKNMTFYIFWEVAHVFSNTDWLDWVGLAPPSNSKIFPKKIVYKLKYRY